MRVVSWNIHGSVGADGRFDPNRVARVLARLEPDIVLLQEVGERHGRQTQVDQAELLAREMGMICAVGITVEAGPFGYGLATLSRHPLLDAETVDLSVTGREPRACLRVVTAAGAARLTLLNVHLGLAWGERRRQLERMLRHEGPLGRPPAPMLLAGDFNDWPPGRVTRLLGRHLVDVGLGRGRTFPARIPMFRLDRIYAGRGLRVVSYRVCGAHGASDHRPLFAEIALVPEEIESTIDQPYSSSSEADEAEDFSRSSVR
jgi:endonuclease/exonuclease/phosphatase family metal-dependent hydrolase